MADSPIPALMSSAIPLVPEAVHVDAHELHRKLTRAAEPFDVWISRLVARLCLVEGEDFTTATSHAVAGIPAGAPAYRLTTEAAKAICVASESAEGRAQWRQFIAEEHRMVRALVARLIGATA